MPSRQEQELLQLLAQQRRRNAEAHQQPEAQRLPALTPEMLTSAAGQRELEAMRQIRRPFQAEQNAAQAAALEATIQRPERPQLVDAIQAAMREHVIEQTDSAALDPYPLDLEQLFMNREAQDAAQVLASEGTYAAPNTGLDVQFDDPGDLGGRTTPNESARWQIGREPPPPVAFDRGRRSGPSEGTVVSSRREDGSWAAQQARQAARRPLLAMPPPTVQSAQSRPTSARPATPAPRPAEAPYNGPRPTVYEHILKDDIL